MCDEEQDLDQDDKPVYSPFIYAPQDLEWVDYQRKIVQAICTAFAISPEELGVPSTLRNTYDQ